MIMRLGEGGEDWKSMPSVKVDVSIPAPPPPFTYADAGNRVRMVVPAGRAQDFLLAQLEAARQAASRNDQAGKQQATNAFIAELQTHASINVPAAEAQVLLMLVRGL
jgi:hypothetical protein